MHMLGKNKGERREMKGGKEGRGKGCEMILFSLVCSVPKKKKKNFKERKGKRNDIIFTCFLCTKKNFIGGSHHKNSRFSPSLNFLFLHSNPFNLVLFFSQSF